MAIGFKVNGKAFRNSLISLFFYFLPLMIRKRLSLNWKCQILPFARPVLFDENLFSLMGGCDCHLWYRFFRRRRKGQENPKFSNFLSRPQSLNCSWHTFLLCIELLSIFTISFPNQWFYYRSSVPSRFLDGRIVHRSLSANRLRNIGNLMNLRIQIFHFKSVSLFSCVSKINERSSRWINTKLFDFKDLEISMLW